MPQLKPNFETFAKIKVAGVGGSGTNAVTRMVDKKIHGVEFIAINSDAQDLHHTKASQRIHIGKDVTRGLGAGMDPELGRRAAEESREDIARALEGADMVFVTCGLGGGTGSGAAPIIAEIASDLGALTIAVITKPFSFEGRQRARIAEEAWHKLKDQVDAIVTIPNDRVLNLIDRETRLLDAFRIVDDVLRHGVQGISDLVTVPGLINLDFADVRAIMANAGPALMGIGRGTGEDRAESAAKHAISSPLLELSIAGANRVLFNVRGGPDLTMAEVEHAAKIITEAIDQDAKVIFGAMVDDALRKGEVKLTVIATGFAPAGQNPQDFGSKPQHILENATELPQEKTRIDAPPARSVSNAKQEQGAPGENNEEELEIPAFIRRRMR